jgi:hypothetical protein
MHSKSIGIIASKTALLLAALTVTISATRATEDGKYPDLRGQWTGVMRTVQGLPGQPSFDPSKPWGKGQEAPLTPEYQAIMEANIKSQAEGGPGDHLGTSCLGFGMPIITYGFEPMEFIVTPETTYVLINWIEHTRRIYRDGRDWPAQIDPTLTGYSIGKWIDADHDGRYSALEVETRGPFKGPRDYDASGLPLHRDNQSIFKERIWRDKANPDILHDEITSIDHALTRPWTVDKRYVRNPAPRLDWPEFYTTENNAQVVIGKENYFLSGDGMLMPAKKGQAPPDLRYFNPTSK